jgi:hypothetical protein
MDQAINSMVIYLLESSGYTSAYEGEFAVRLKMTVWGQWLKIFVCFLYKLYFFK